MKPLGRMTRAERFAAVAPFNGRVVRVTYRTLRQTPERAIVARCVGAAEHLTNGTSSGELVLVPVRDDHVFENDHGQHRAVVIALSLVTSIERAGAGQTLAAVGNASAVTS